MMAMQRLIYKQTTRWSIEHHFTHESRMIVCAVVVVVFAQVSWNWNWRATFNTRSSWWVGFVLARWRTLATPPSLPPLRSVWMVNCLGCRMDHTALLTSFSLLSPPFLWNYLSSYLSLSPATHSRSKWQGDQTLEFKVAKFFTNVAQKVAKQVVNKKEVFKIAQKVAQYLG